MWLKCIFVFFLVTACQVKPTVGLSAALGKSRMNYFDTDLLKYAVEEKPGNILVSPASIRSALAMLLEGAQGVTANEIKSALRLSRDKEDFREELSKYLLSLKPDPNSTTILENSNMIFKSPKVVLKKEFEIMMSKVYMADAQTVEFNKPGLASKTINDWVNNKTKGLVMELVDPMLINPSSDLLISNVIYFKSDWKYKFDPRETRVRCFYNKDVCHNVEMMELSTDLNYAFIDDLKAHAVELPYKDSKYSMVLLVPEEKNGWYNIVRDLPYMSLSQICSTMEITDVMLSMPKFTINHSEDIVPALQRMKILSLFTPAANLSNMFDGISPDLSNIYHKVYLKVDETGSEATAATGVMVVPLMASIVTLTVDRPFVFFIRDTASGLVLFEGKVELPNVVNVAIAK